jgi:hypothetical protein
MDALTRHQRIAQRFLISVLKRYRRDAPEVLRNIADELDGLAEAAAGPNCQLRRMAKVLRSARRYFVSCMRDS